MNFSIINLPTIKWFLLFHFFISLSINAQKATTIQIDEYYNEGSFLLESNKLEEAFQNFNLGLEEAKKSNNELLIAEGNFNIAEYYLKKKDMEQAILFYMNALNDYNNLKNQTEVSKCYQRLANVYRRVTNYEKSLFYNFEYLRINELLNDESQMAIALDQIGSIYLRTGDYDDAEISLKRALELNLKSNNRKEILSNYSSLGALNQKNGNYEVALEYFNKGLKETQELGLKNNESILLGNIGSTNRSLNNYDESLSYLFRALEIKKQLKNKRGSTAHTCNDISETYMKLNDFVKAKEYAMLAIEYSENENLDQERYAYYLLSKWNYKLGEFEESYNNLNIYNRLNDSVFSIKKAASIKELQVKYDVEKQDLKIKTQEADIALLDEKNKVKNQWLLFGGLGLLGIFGFVMLNRSISAAKKRGRLQEKFSHDLIAAQEDERTRVSKDLHDSVGQQLTLVKRKAQVLEQEELSLMINTALEEVRGISRALYPSNLKQLGLTESIEQLLLDIDEVSEMFFSINIENIDLVFNEEQSLNFYRFIQEAVNNVLKHAKAKALLVSIKKSNDFVEVLIKDNGLGFDDVRALKKKSLGLKTMSERIRMLKGNLIIESQKGEGAVITAKIAI